MELRSNSNYKKKKKFIVAYDTETTGLNVKKDKIIEFSYSKLFNYTGDTILINPLIDIPSKSTEIHGISNDMVIDKKIFGELIDNLEKDIIFKNEDNNIYLLAHNGNNFDEKILREEYRRINRNIPDNFKFIDSYAIVKKKIDKNSIDNYKLETLKKYYKIDIDDNLAHTAKADVEVLCELWEKLVEEYDEDEIIKISLEHRDKINNEKMMHYGKYNEQLISSIPDDYVNSMIRTGQFHKNEDLFNRFKKYNNYFKNKNLNIKF